MKFLYPFLKEIKFWFEKYNSSNKVSDYEKLMSQWRALFFQSSWERGEADGKHILFVTGYGLGSHYYLLEPILMQALRQRGAKISSIICGKSLPACEFNTNGNNKPRVPFQLRNGLLESTIKNKCELCSANAKEVLKVMGVDFDEVNKYLSEDDYIRAERIIEKISLSAFRKFQFEGIAVGEEAFASILRATFKGEVGNKTNDDKLKKRYLLAGILTTMAYMSAFSSLKPDKIVCIHGIYQTHGLAVKVAKKLGIPVDVIGGGGIRKNTIVACHGETYHHQLINEDNKIWNQQTLTQEQIDRTLKYAKAKRNSGAGVDYLSYHPNPIEDKNELLKSLNIEETDNIVAIYTNVIWDAQVAYKSNVFDDIFDWLWTTIDVAALNKEITLVIRIHPAESKGGVPTKQPMLKEIQNRYPVLAENIKIIAPSSDLSSYTLASLAKVNVIYGTKMGLEIALLKSPLIVAGETFSRNKGYGYDISSKQAYIDILNNIDEFAHNYNTGERFEIALKYAHYLYFRRMLDLPLTDITKNGKNEKNLTYNDLSFLNSGNMNTLDVICKGILENSDFYLK